MQSILPFVALNSVTSVGAGPATDLNGVSNEGGSSPTVTATIAVGRII